MSKPRLIENFLATKRRWIILAAVVLPAAIVLTSYFHGSETRSSTFRNAKNGYEMLIPEGWNAASREQYDGFYRPQPGCCGWLQRWLSSYTKCGCSENLILILLTEAANGLSVKEWFRKASAKPHTFLSLSEERKDIRVDEYPIKVDGEQVLWFRLNHIEGPVSKDPLGDNTWVALAFKHKDKIYAFEKISYANGLGHFVDEVTPQLIEGFKFVEP